jgi:hypothetical protein
MTDCKVWWVGDNLIVTCGELRAQGTFQRHLNLHLEVLMDG